MKVNVRLPSALRQYAGGQNNVPLEGNTVGEILKALTDRHAPLKRHLLDEKGSLRSFVSIFLNDESINQLQGEETAVNEGDTVLIVPAIAGGKPTVAGARTADPSVTELIDYEEFCGIRGVDMEMQTDREITVKELKRKLDDGEDVVILDVREPHEYEISRLPGSRIIPLGELDERLSELSTADDLVVHCRSGSRSARAVRLLRKHGFLKAVNLKGGILAWSDEVDSSVVKY